MAVASAPGRASGRPGHAAVAGLAGFRPRPGRPGTGTAAGRFTGSGLETGRGLATSRARHRIRFRGLSVGAPPGSARRVADPRRTALDHATTRRGHRESLAAG